MNDTVTRSIGEVFAMFPKGTPAGDAAEARLAAEAAARPTYVFRCVMPKSAVQDGFATRAAAEKRRARTYGDAEVVERDGMFYVEAVVTLAPADETSPCTDCGRQVPTIATGRGAFEGERCSNGTATFPRHRVSGDAYEAAVLYKHAAEVVANGTDPRYTVVKAG